MRRHGRLAELADVITPNLTEAAFLLNKPYGELPKDPEGLREIVTALSLQGKRSVVLTGVSLRAGKTGAMCYDAASGRIETVQTDFVAHPLHGTGDVFASVLTGALVKGEALVSRGTGGGSCPTLSVRTVEQNLPLRRVWILNRAGPFDTQFPARRCH